MHVVCDAVVELLVIVPASHTLLRSADLDCILSGKYMRANISYDLLTDSVDSENSSNIVDKIFSCIFVFNCCLHVRKCVTLNFFLLSRGIIRCEEQATCPRTKHLRWTFVLIHNSPHLLPSAYPDLIMINIDIRIFRWPLRRLKRIIYVMLR